MSLANRIARLEQEQPDAEPAASRLPLLPDAALAYLTALNRALPDALTGDARNTAAQERSPLCVSVVQAVDRHVAEQRAGKVPIVAIQAEVLRGATGHLDSAIIRAMQSGETPYEWDPYRGVRLIFGDDSATVLAAWQHDERLVALWRSATRPAADTLAQAGIGDLETALLEAA